MSPSVYVDVALDFVQHEADLITPPHDAMVKTTPSRQRDGRRRSSLSPQRDVELELKREVHKDLMPLELTLMQFVTLQCPNLEKVISDVTSRSSSTSSRHLTSPLSVHPVEVNLNRRAKGSPGCNFSSQNSDMSSGHDDLQQASPSSSEQPYFVEREPDPQVETVDEVSGATNQEDELPPEEPQLREPRTSTSPVQLAPRMQGSHLSSEGETPQFNFGTRNNKPHFQQTFDRPLFEQQLHPSLPRAVSQLHPR